MQNQHCWLFLPSSNCPQNVLVYTYCVHGQSDLEIWCTITCVFLSPRIIMNCCHIWVSFFSLFYFFTQEIELVFKPHPKDHDPETVAQQTRYIKTTANASGELTLKRKKICQQSSSHTHKFTSDLVAFLFHW